MNSILKIFIARRQGIYNYLSIYPSDFNNCNQVFYKSDRFVMTILLFYDVINIGNCLGGNMPKNFFLIYEKKQILGIFIKPLSF